jgi:hypothetical protein
MDRGPPQPFKKEEARWRLDQLASVGSELLWRARHVARLVQQRIQRLLERDRPGRAEDSSQEK